MIELKDDLSNIKQVIKYYATKIKEGHSDIKLSGKLLPTANTEQPSLMAYYDEIKATVKHIMSYVEMELRKKKGQLFSELQRNSPKALTVSELEKLVDCSEDYLHIYQKFLDTKELYDKATVVVNGFTQRSYSLTNLVKIYERELQDITIYMDEN